MFPGVHTGCDVGLAKAASAAAAPRPRLVLTICILSSSLAMIDGSVVNVALPAMAKSLHGEAVDLQWVINAYLLPLSALLLLGGSLGDRFGRARLLVAGVGIFAAASAICALAPNLGWLWAARAAQGVGAAILLPNSLAILGGAFSGEARGKAIGIWAASGSVAAAIGPLLGGWLTDVVGWRAIFAINLPLAAAAIWLARRHLRDDAQTQEPPHLDAAGALLATLSLGALAWGLTLGSGPQGWNRAAVIGIVVGFGLLLAFGATEHKRGERAMTPLAIFGSRGFVGLSLLTLLVYGVLGGLLVLLPYVLITAGGYSATTAGAALTPLPVLLAIASPAVGGLAGRMGSKLPLTLGPLLTGLGVLALLRVGQTSSYWTTVLPAILLISAGMSLTAAPLTTAVLGSVDARHSGVASGLNSALARTGGLIVTALLGGVLARLGADLIASFHSAVFVGALMCFAAAGCAQLLPKASANNGAKRG